MDIEMEAALREITKSGMYTISAGVYIPALRAALAEKFGAKVWVVNHGQDFGLMGGNAPAMNCVTVKIGRDKLHRDDWVPEWRRR